MVHHATLFDSILISSGRTLNSSTADTKARYWTKALYISTTAWLRTILILSQYLIALMIYSGSRLIGAIPEEQKQIENVTRNCFAYLGRRDVLLGQ
jgi:hypothetical protein